MEDTKIGDLKEMKKDDTVTFHDEEGNEHQATITDVTPNTAAPLEPSLNLSYTDESGVPITRTGIRHKNAEASPTPPMSWWY